MGFLSESQLYRMGFRDYGKNVFISDKCSIYNPQNIIIGDNVRIDDFCILSAGTLIRIGDYVHISCYASLIGAGKIIVGSFVSISGRVSIYSSNDDYTGLGMTNPMVPEEYRRVTDGDVVIEDHAIIGCGSVVLPNVTIKKGASIGALSLIKKDCDELTIYVGAPIREVSKRNKRFLQYEKIIRDNQ